MNIQFYHRPESEDLFQERKAIYTMAVEVPSKSSLLNLTNSPIQLNVGLCYKHPKDSPNKKLARELSTSRMLPVHFTISSVFRDSKGWLVYLTSGSNTHNCTFLVQDNSNRPYLIYAK